jgi:hypothetical protein
MDDTGSYVYIMFIYLKFKPLEFILILLVSVSMRFLYRPEDAALCQSI